MPTTVVKTIRASGGDYTTLSAWEAAQQGDLVTADEVRVAECYNDWPSGLVDQIIVAGWVTDATRYAKITVAAGHRHDGTPQSGFFIKKSVGGYASILDASQSFTRLEYVDAENTATSNAYGIIVRNASNAHACIAKSNASSFGFAFYLFTGSGAVAQNCLAYGGSDGFNLAGSQRAFNCIATTCGKGFSAGSWPTAKNCVAYNNTTNWSGTWSGADTNNATSSASDDAPGGNSVWGVTSAAFVNAASNDFHLAAGSVLIGAGANLYSDFTTDVDGDTWPSSGAWDIGFDYYVAGGGTTVSLNQSTETDTAQPVGKAKYKAFGQATTSDAAQAITAARRVAMGQVVETDSAQAVGRQKVRALGQATETSTAQPITEAGAITAAVGQAVETDSAQAVTSRKIMAIGQPGEADAAQAVAPRKARAIGQAAESASAQAFAVSKTVALGQASETDSAQAITLPGVQVIALGMVTESEFSQAVAAYKRLGILQPVETDSAHSITAIKRKGFGQVVEADLAQGMTASGGAAVSDPFVGRRLYTVPPENRIYTVPPENRIYTVPRENRIYTVKD